MSIIYYKKLKMGNNISVSCNINVVVTKTIDTKSALRTRELLPDLSEVTCTNYILRTALVENYGRLHKNIAVVYCNSYDGTCYSLGDCAKNDGTLAYKKLSEHGYDVIVYHDLSKEITLSTLKQLLELQCEHILVYYIGHGMITYTNQSKFEQSGYDSAYYTKTGIITDNELKDLITTERVNTNIRQFRFISDCCHSGSMYDFTNDDYKKHNMVAVGACGDTETAKQDYICRRGHGVFSYYFWKYYEFGIELHELIDKINHKLAVYNQSAEVSTDLEVKNVL
jgi:hypothetical protein